MKPTYWHTQTPENPLYPDIAWSKPEQRQHAGKIAIIGGNKLGFAAVAQAYSDALEAGIGECRAILPDALKTAIPSSVSETVFTPSTPSGSIAKEGEPQLTAATEWASMTLLIGDTGRNSETAISLETLLRRHAGPAVITRDAVDLLKHSSMALVTRKNTLFVVSFAQLQKLFQAVYYPKILTFSMQLLNLVEALHKFTITYPVSIVTFHHQQLIVAHNGDVTTTPWQNPMAIWRGSVATKAAVYWAWNPSKPLEATSASLIAT